MTREDVIDMMKELAKEFDLTCSKNQYSDHTVLYVKSPYFEDGKDAAAILSYTSFMQFVDVCIIQELNCMTTTNHIAVPIAQTDKELARERIITLLRNIESAGHQIESIRIGSSGDTLRMSLLNCALPSTEGNHG